MNEVYCNDPTCKEHYCQVSGRRLNVKDNIYPDAIILTQWQLNIQKRIEELENKIKTRFPKLSEIKEEEFNLTFREAFQAMKEGLKVRCSLWSKKDYIYLNESQIHFIE